jgi:hypothetical protein
VAAPKKSRFDIFKSSSNHKEEEGVEIVPDPEPVVIKPPAKQTSVFSFFGSKEANKSSSSTPTTTPETSPTSAGSVQRQQSVKKTTKTAVKKNSKPAAKKGKSKTATRAQPQKLPLKASEI